MRLARVRVEEECVTVAALGEQALVRTDWLVPGTPTDDSVALLGDAGIRQQITKRLNRLGESLAAGDVSLRWLQNERIAFFMDEVRFAPPVSRCPKCIGIALNYPAHAAEGNFVPPTEPAFFFKAPTSLIGHMETVVAPPVTNRLDYELELGVVVGRRARGLTAENWHEAIAGYTILNDVTARDLQFAAIEAQLPWDRTKSFDTFGPVGPWLLTPDEVPDPQNLELELKVGDTVRQKGNTGQMLFSVAHLMVTLSADITLEPGDIIATGTPAGIGPVYDGEVMYGRVGHLGTLSNPVRYSGERSNLQLERKVVA